MVEIPHHCIFCDLSVLNTETADIKHIDWVITAVSGMAWVVYGNSILNSNILSNLLWHTR